MVREWHRRRRRRAAARRLAPVLALAGVVAVVVVIAVGTVSQVAPASGAYHRAVNKGYAALAVPLVAQSDGLASQVRDVVANGASYDRPRFFSQLDFLASSAATLAHQFDQITPPDLSGVSGTECTSAMTGRSQAVASVRQALEGLLGGTTGDGPGAGDQAAAARALTSVPSEVEASDAAWSSCRAALRRAPGAAHLPPSVWIGDPSAWSSDTLGKFVSAVAGSTSLAARHGLGIPSATTLPAPLPGGSGGFLVAPTTSLQVNVVVQDAGNVDEPQAVVTGSLAPAGGAGGKGSQAPATVSRRVDAGVAAGGSAAVAISGLVVSPGTSYTLQVTVDAPGVTAQPLQLPVQVEPAVSTTLVVPSSSTVRVGRAVTYTAIVSTSVGGLPPATGTVAFEQDGAPIPSCGTTSIARARATCPVAYRSTGTHSITAVYSGDAIRSASTSPSQVEKVVR